MIFLRHPAPDIDLRICYGQTDMDIAEIGHQQIEKAIELTPKITRLIASPALRCRKLALCLAERDGVEPIFDERLWEMNMGDFEGVPWDQIDRTLSDKWLQDPINNRPPGGEAFIEVQQRVVAVVEACLDDDKMHTAIVCHGGPIRSVQMAWHGMSYKEAFAQIPPFAMTLRLLPKEQSTKSKLRPSGKSRPQKIS